MEQLERARSSRLDAGLIKELFRSEDYEYRFPASRGERVVIEGRVNQVGYSLLRPLIPEIGLRCLELNPNVAQDGP